MITPLRQRAAEAISAARWVTLASGGPAGIQASRLPCEGRGLCLYILLPATSDQLFNLEQQPEVALVAENWQGRGPARILLPGQRPARLFTAQPADAHSDVVVEVRPVRFTFQHPAGWGADETIELIE
jgi:hypothetical protein